MDIDIEKLLQEDKKERIENLLRMTYAMLQDKRLHGPHRGVLDKYIDDMRKLLQELLAAS